MLLKAFEFESHQQW